MSAVTFVVAGLPAPQGSKAHVGNNVLVESSKALAPWRQTVAWTSRAAMNQRRLLMFIGAVHVHCDFVMPRPKRCPSPTPPATKRPDLDKLERACWDAITGTCVADDSLVTRSSASKRIAEPGEPTGVTITVTEIA